MVAPSRLPARSPERRHVAVLRARRSMLPLVWRAAVLRARRSVLSLAWRVAVLRAWRSMLPLVWRAAVLRAWRSVLPLVWRVAVRLRFGSHTLLRPAAPPWLVEPSLRPKPVRQQ